MDMNDELWHRVKDTPRVTGFVGGGTTPVPLSADEINKMLYLSDDEVPNGRVRR